MGFIEDLRRQKELKAKKLEDAHRFTSAKEEQQRALLTKAEELRKRAELEKANEIGRQLKQTEAHFAKSEFARLSKELASTVGEITLVKGMIDPDSGWHAIYEYKYDRYPRDNNIHELSPEDKRYYLDRHSQLSEAGVSIIWYEGKTEQREKKDGYGRHEYDVWEDIYSLVAIGCDQAGQIILRKSWGDIKLPMSKWLGNPAIQEEALGRAYNNPKHLSQGRDNDGRDHSTSIQPR